MKVNEMNSDLYIVRLSCQTKITPKIRFVESKVVYIHFKVVHDSI